VEPDLKMAGGAEGTRGAIRPEFADALRRIRQIQGERVVRLARPGCYWALEMLPAGADDLTFCPRALEL
jgi:hypothetical protein